MEDGFKAALVIIITTILILTGSVYLVDQIFIKWGFVAATATLTQTLPLPSLIPVTLTPSPNPSPTPDITPNASPVSVKPTSQPAPTPQPQNPVAVNTGCFVTLFGAVYNMQPLLGTEVKIISQTNNKTKKKTHQSGDQIQCGTKESPLDQSNVFQEKHYNKNGCWPNLDPYFVSGNKPNLTPVCQPA